MCSRTIRDVPSTPHPITHPLDCLHPPGQVPVACDDGDAARAVCSLLEAIQLKAVWVGKLHSARAMEREQFQVQYTRGWKSSDDAPTNVEAPLIVRRFGELHSNRYLPLSSLPRSSPSGAGRCS